jgi:hypothetical protein
MLGQTSARRVQSGCSHAGSSVKTGSPWSARDGRALERPLNTKSDQREAHGEASGGMDGGGWLAVGWGSWVWQLGAAVGYGSWMCCGGCGSSVRREGTTRCGGSLRSWRGGGSIWRCLGEAGQERQGLFQHGARRGGGPCVGCGSRTERRAGALER